jgi:hypothetical protein
MTHDDRDGGGEWHEEGRRHEDRKRGSKGPCGMAAGVTKYARLSLLHDIIAKRRVHQGTRSTRFDRVEERRLGARRRTASEGHKDTVKTWKNNAIRRQRQRVEGRPVRAGVECHEHFFVLSRRVRLAPSDLIDPSTLPSGVALIGRLELLPGYGGG